jgi:hypothetical protein
MSTAGSVNTRPGRLRIVSALLLPALLASTLTACSDDSPVTSTDPDADAAAAIQRTLHQRAKAIVNRDPVLFGRTLAERDRAFVAEQEQYLDNLGQLPLGVVRFDLTDESLEPDGKAYWGEVTIRIEIEGYDVAPVVTRDRWRFAPTRDERRYLLTSTTDGRWEADHAPQPQPWDLGEIEVRDGPGVLGIFDASTIGSAPDVLDAVSEARFAVRSVLPLDIEDPGGVILYLLGDPTFLDSLDGLPVADPSRLDGATIPVPRDADGGAGRVSSYRILLNPSVIGQDDEALDRLVRHELTHVAVGDRARGVPLWFSEGLAEYVSVQQLLPSERRLQSDALNLAAAGVDDLPTDEEFAGEHAEGWYAVSWWVCEYIAATYGEDTLWILLAKLADGADQSAVISEQLGISTSELVHDGIDLMRHTYG